jgi:hypothetical protein
MEKNVLQILIVVYLIMNLATGYGRSGDRMPVGARFFAPVQNSPRAHPVSCTLGTGSLPGPDADPSPPSSAEV